MLTKSSVICPPLLIVRAYKGRASPFLLCKCQLVIFPISSLSRASELELCTMSVNKCIFLEVHAKQNGYWSVLHVVSYQGKYELNISHNSTPKRSLVRGVLVLISLCAAEPLFLLRKGQISP